MTAHKSNEAYLFASPLITDNDEYTAPLRLLLPNASNEIITYIDEVFYPAIYNESYPWTTQLQRTLAAIDDSRLVCNIRYMDLELQSTMHAYYFDNSAG
jgi:heptaprenylglyceryl phosphate synthase